MTRVLKLNLTVILLIFSFSNVFACEEESYQITIQDFSGVCGDIIIATAEQMNCSAELINNLKLSISDSNAIDAKNNVDTSKFKTFNFDLSNFCIIRSVDGRYQVMNETTGSPPVATIYFTTYD